MNSTQSAVEFSAEEVTGQFAREGVQVLETEERQLDCSPEQAARDAELMDWSNI